VKTRAFKVTHDEEGVDLLSFIADRLRSSRNRAKAVIDRRDVAVNEKRVWMARHSLHSGDSVVVCLRQARSETACRVPAILYRDDDCIVVSKPPGILSNGKGSAEEVLRGELGIPGLRSIHRLDRDTTGCLMLARTTAAFGAMVKEFKNKSVTKVYHAIARGRFPRKETTIKARIDGKSALTRIRLLDANQNASHLMINIQTGRTHQIRIHLAGTGHPVLGDRQYGMTPLSGNLLQIPRQMLHASSLQFTNPTTGKRTRIEDPLPKDFLSSMKRFKLK